MGRLIDADYFIENLAVAPMIQEAMRKAVNHMPTVEVIRCKDCVYCKHFNDVWYLPKKDELLCTLYVETYSTTENDYCSRGERK